MLPIEEYVHLKSVQHSYKVQAMHVDRRVQNTSNNSMDEFVFPVDLVLTIATVSKLQTVTVCCHIRYINDLSPKILTVISFSLAMKCQSSVNQT